MSQVLNQRDLQAYIDTYGLQAAILPMKTHTATVAEAATALGVDGQLIIKSLLFLAGEQPILVINNGPARVDRKKLAAFLGMNRKRVKFANAQQALAITGYVVGGMPPFGHRQPLRTLVDRAVTARHIVYGGGGDIDAMLRVSSSELLRVTGAEIIDISTD